MNIFKGKTILLSFISILSVSLLLSGCGKENARDNDLLSQVKDSGTLKVGVMGTYAPYNFLNDKKQMDGFDVDIAKEVAKGLGVKAKFVSQEFSGMIPGLKSKKFDAVISQMTITDERKKQMDFTQPYITNDVKIIVKQNNNTIKSLQDFKGKNVGVGLGTNDETYLRTKVLPQVGQFKIKTYDDVITSLKDLDAGRIDATVNNIYALQPIVEKNGFKLKTVGEPIKSDKAAIAVRKGNKTFVKALDKALTDMKKDGTYDKIFNKWFGNSK
ncbi:transporter substrate-binding domain-containing protein [Terrilactibacillus sp. BCM23-1]|uniref:Transporter substrate-binding domain-containing protein n=1 Tax=Terrilactibacillus tamarindi TaxID=2599694 RepID=A0A6N8CTS6_9BACI|nr:transporter substrate-binding domain-containing protein [Terrilactibacillus tamarindi]MTT31406.1 transporter substrate-binding domain-containing protein [Terrilactibacillus tamarindi]